MRTCEVSKRPTKIMKIPLLGYLAVFSALIPIVIGLRNFRILKRDAIMVLLYLSISAGFSILQLVMAKMGHNNLWIGHLTRMLDTCVMLCLFGYWSTTYYFRRILQWMAFGFFFFWSIMMSNMEPFVQESLIVAPISRLILCIGSLIFLHELNQNSNKSILKDWRFWVASSNLIYSSSSVLLDALRRPIAQFPTNKMFLAFKLVWLLFIFSQAILAYAFICYGHEGEKE